MMLNKVTALAAVFFIATSALGFSGKNKALTEPDVGSKAPQFTAVDSNGKKHSLSEYQGKVVVLEWLNHGCPYVKKHYRKGNMQELQKRLTAEGAVWLSVISSAPGKQGHVTAAEANKEAKEKKSLASAILLDPEGKVGKLYGAKTTPHMFVIDKSGRVAYRGAIDSVRSTDPDDIAGAENYVLAAFGAVQKGVAVAKPATTAYGCSVKYKN